MPRTASGVDFAVSNDEIRLIERIVARFIDETGPQDRISLEMDLAATHRNGCPLDFQKLLAAPAFDLIHDVAGIRRHLDRRTGQLGECFVPRCALPEAR